MSYAIIGFGNIGHALAESFARKGIEVSIATTRDPQSFASAAAAIGPTIIPKKLAEAVKADIVFLAVRFESHPEFVAQGDRVLVVGLATGRIKATNRTFEDNWVFDITVRNNKVTKIREYIDTQALARASKIGPSHAARSSNDQP